MSGKEIAHFTGEETLRLSRNCVYHSKYQEFFYLNGHLHNFRSMIVLNTNKIKNIKNI